jgi:predicted transcriptional regulator
MSEANTLPLTAGIVASFVEKNRIAATELPDVIRAVHRTLVGLGQPEPHDGAAAMKLTPAQIRKSITPGALVSFEDGRPYRLLTRHLRKLGLTPKAYRAKWGLPVDYPMTAPDYAKQRSDMAKALGLGKRVRRDASAAK